MKVIVVYNPKSGSALSRRELRSLFAAHDIEITQLLPVDEKLPSRLRRLAKRNVRVAVIGGDGTISNVADILAGSKAMLVPLPGGTLNHFTKDLGIPQSLDKALSALKHAVPRRIDVASVNGKVFVNNSSIGLYPSSLRERERIEDMFGKVPALVISVIRTFVRLPGFMVTIGADTFRTPFVFIGNNDYKLDDLGAPVRTRLDAGELSVFIAKDVSRTALLRIMFMAFIGRAHLLDDFEVHRARSLTIKTAHTRPSVSLDGEVGHMDSPLHYEIQPASLRVLG